MKKIGKVVCFGVLILIVTLSTSSLIIKPIIAESIPNPPEFTLKYVDRSFDRPTTYKTDPLTGQAVVNELGYHVSNRNIDVSIRNQPFTPYLNPDGNYTRLYYEVRYKGHYENQWRDVSDPKYYGYYNVSQSGYTNVTTNLEYYYSNSLNALLSQNQTESSFKVDVQVETLIGNDFFIPTITPWGPSGYYEFFGQTSGFSDIHTIDLGSNTITIIPNTSTTPEYTPQNSNTSPTIIPSSTSEPPTSPSPSPTVPEFSWLTILPLLLSIPIVLIVIRKRVLSGNSSSYY